MMKLIVALLAAFTFGSNAIADETIMIGEYRDRFSGWDEIVVSFQLNPKLNRVWVEVGEDENGGESSWYDTIDRVKLKNLRYEEVSGDEKILGRIIYSAPEQDVVCAERRKHKFLFAKWKSLKQLADCSFTVEKFTKEYDNGFEIERRRMVRVLLTVKEN